MNRAYAHGMAKAASLLGMNPTAAELLGLGALGTIPIRKLVSHLRGVEEDPAIAEPVDAALDLVGLSTLALPALAHLRGKGA